MKKTNKKILIWVLSVALAISLIIGGCAVYVSDYYRADTEAIRAFVSGDNVTRTAVSDKMITYGEANFDVGFIFYPGGKVEYTAYEPLMIKLASQGIFCVLLKMPFNLAVLDINAANGISELYPDIDIWYIGGHSLGGSMAASYAAKHAEDFAGIILLASYSTADLSKTSLRTLSLYGSEDGVLNKEKYETYKKNLPSGTSEIVIEGGCHAYFGMYGEQKGDGKAKIKKEEQIIFSSDCIAEFIFGIERVE